MLLIDVKKYNEYKILDDINEIAMANGHGMYVCMYDVDQKLCMYVCM